MFFQCFHALSRNGPHTVIEVNLRPGGPELRRFAQQSGIVNSSARAAVPTLPLSSFMNAGISSIGNARWCITF